MNGPQPVHVTNAQVELVMMHTGCAHKKAMDVLVMKSGDVVAAILLLSTG